MKLVRLAALLLVLPATAQVFVVDVNNGPGTHFTDLAVAAARVPDGASLHVRAGTYNAFALSGKGVRIFGEGVVTVQLTAVSSQLSFANTSPSQLVFVRGLSFLVPVALQGCAEAVVFEQCQAAAPAVLASTLRIDACRNVWLHECVFTEESLFPGSDRIAVSDSRLVLSRSVVSGVQGQQASFGTTPGGPGTAALHLVRSRCLLFDGWLTGGRGGSGCRSCGLPGCAAPGGPGGPGMRLDAGSTAFVFGGQVVGGPGGAGACCQFGGCENPGDGGPGVLLAGGAGQFFGSTPLGGVAGIGGTGIAFPGPPSRGNGTLVVDGNARPSSGWIDGDQARSKTITFALRAAPASPALLMLSYRQALVPAEPLGHGWVLAFPALFVGPFSVDASGLLLLPLSLPATLPLGEAYAGQFATLELASSTLWLTNPFSLAVDR